MHWRGSGSLSVCTMRVPHQHWSFQNNLSHYVNHIDTDVYTDACVIEIDPQLTELSSCVTQVERPPPPGSTFSPDRMAISASQAVVAELRFYLQRFPCLCRGGVDLCASPPRRLLAMNMEDSGADVMGRRGSRKQHMIPGLH